MVSSARPATSSPANSSTSSRPLVPIRPRLQTSACQKWASAKLRTLAKSVVLPTISHSSGKPKAVRRSAARDGSILRHQLLDHLVDAQARGAGARQELLEALKPFSEEGRRAVHVRVEPARYQTLQLGADCCRSRATWLWRLQSCLGPIQRGWYHEQACSGAT